MASYNTVRTAEAQPIGSIVPWGGALTKIPKGWLLCNGAELSAGDFPLLARILKDTYGGNGFSGTFPNYSGTFKLPSINQKALADISVGYFTSTTLAQPTINVDTVAAAAVISPFIGTEGDLGPAQTVYARTDLNFSYTPDPDGIITTFTFTGTAPTATVTTLYSNVSVTPGSGVTGTGATFNVVKNTNQTYTVILKQKGQGYVVGNTLTIPYNLIGGSSTANNITITVTGVGNGYFAGSITGSSGKLTFTSGFGITPVYIVPRKLGRQHFPQHFHAGTYETINKNDVSDNPGFGVGVYDNQTVTVRDYAWCLYPAYPFIQGGGRYTDTGSCGSSTNKSSVNIWGNSQTNGTISVSAPFDVGVGRYALASIAGTAPARTHTALYTSAGGNGVGKSWFNSAKNLRDANNNSTVSGNTALTNLKSDGKVRAGTYIPFSDEKALQYYINYDDGPAAGLGSDLAQTYQTVMFNNAATSFTQITRANLVNNDVIQGHDHQGSMNISYNVGSLFIPSSIAAVASPNVTPDNVPSAFQIIFTVPTPSLAITNLIRAY